MASTRKVTKSAVEKHRQKKRVAAEKKGTAKKMKQESAAKKQKQKELASAAKKAMKEKEWKAAEQNLFSLSGFVHQKRRELASQTSFQSRSPKQLPSKRDQKQIKGQADEITAALASLSLEPYTEGSINSHLCNTFVLTYSIRYDSSVHDCQTFSYF